MKDKMLAIGKSLALLCICSILFSLIFSTLYYAHILSQSIFHILNWIFGCATYFLAGVLLGLGIKKKALLHALVIIIVMGVLGCFFMDAYTILDIVEFASKMLAYALGCILMTMKQ